MWSRKCCSKELVERLRCCARISPRKSALGEFRRHFSEGNKNDNLKFPGGGFRNSRLIFRWSSIPVPLKAFGAITGSAALIHFVTPSSLIVYAPPFALSLWLLNRIITRRERKIQSDRWNQLETYHVVQQPEKWQCEKLDIEHEAKNLIFKAFESNGSELQKLIGHKVQFIPQLKLTSAEIVNQEYRVGPEGLNETMVVLSSKLIDAQERMRIANVTTVIRQVSRRKSIRMRIELMVDCGQIYVLHPKEIDQAGKQHTVIEVVGR